MRFCKPGQKPVAGKVTDPSREATAIALLDDYDVPVKLLSL
jgi:hypothetical protein